MKATQWTDIRAQQTPGHIEKQKNLQILEIWNKNKKRWQHSVGQVIYVYVRERESEKDGVSGRVDNSASEQGKLIWSNKTMQIQDVASHLTETIAGNSTLSS